jgi:lipoprotein-releasing system permease protein
MFHPLPLYIGLRYARARSHRYFVSFITWVSLLGVTVGVAALIVILSVMNGFESELRSRLLALTAPVRVTASEPVADWEPIRARVAQLAGGVPVERYAEMQALAVRQAEMLPLMLRAAGAATTQELSRLLVDGDVQAMSGEDGVVLGRLVAEQLGLVVGDPLTLLVPTVSAGDLPEPRLREVTVVGIFEAGIQDHDAALVYASFDMLTGLGAAASGGEGLTVKLNDALVAPQAAVQLRDGLATAGLGMLTVSDWTAEHGSNFRAIRIEKTMMALILLLIVTVAAFNIVAMLVMVVTDKRTDIAILRTFGASPRAVASVFITQGLIIGWLGVACGVGLGVLLAHNVSAILTVVEKLSGLSLFDADVYYITAVPSELHASDVWLVAVSALIVTLLATIYPARRAAAVSPAEALRYE